MIFIVIVTYNGAKWIHKCLESVQKSEVPVYTIIVDNCSSDNTVSIIKHDFPEMFFIQTKENVGFGKGNNIGIRYAMEQGCDAVFLLNQDAWIEPDTIGKLIKYHDKGILSPIHMNGEGNDLQSNFKEYSLRIPELYRDALVGKKQTLYETSFVNAAAWYIPRSVLETIGGFNPIFFYRGEDNNYIDRAHYFGIKQYIVTDAIIYHDADNRPKRKLTFHDLRTELLQTSLSLNGNTNNNVAVMMSYCRRMLFRGIMHFDWGNARMYFRFLRYAQSQRTTIADNNELQKKGPMF